ncbi:lipase family protein [Halosquirtibacter laminarini]|uniref:Lipase family protein n=1 Tax=Halosquirtibacter laminarini TaxID=3374600 RepID=A0AC61NNQ1_9BACT|nr:lipase family protein [Prolixibacteraceae bacterium]
MRSKINLLLYIFIFSITSSLFTACSKEEVKTPTLYDSSSLIENVDKETTRGLLALNPVVGKNAAEMPLLDIKVYRIVYNTTNYDGKQVKASGALLVPNIDKPLTIISYQHGTIWNESDAPSEYNTGKEIKMLATPLASMGYAVVVPDYIGYGASSDYIHPYEHAETLAKSSFDMLQAAKAFLKEKNVALNNKLVITGYSEGGSATMALHKYMEENSNEAITLSIPASGAYNKTEANKLFAQEKAPSLMTKYFLWIVNTYKTIYQIDTPWTEMLNAPYGEMMNKLNTNFELQYKKVQTIPQALLSKSFIEALTTGNNPQISNAVKDNDRWQWVPKQPMMVFYSSSDNIVNPINSITAIQYMQSQGAPVQAVKVDGYNHYQAFGAYMATLFKVLPMYQ